MLIWETFGDAHEGLFSPVLLKLKQLFHSSLHPSWCLLVLHHGTSNIHANLRKKCVEFWLSFGGSLNNNNTSLLDINDNNVVMNLNGTTTPDAVISTVFKTSLDFVVDDLLEQVEQPIFYYADGSCSFVSRFGESVRCFVKTMLQSVLVGEKEEDKGLKAQFVQRLVERASKSSFPIASLFMLQGVTDCDDGFKCLETRHVDMIVEIMTLDSQKIKWGNPQAKRWFLNIAFELVTRFSDATCISLQTLSRWVQLFFFFYLFIDYVSLFN